MGAQPHSNIHPCCSSRDEEGSNTGTDMSKLHTSLGCTSRLASLSKTCALSMVVCVLAVVRADVSASASMRMCSPKTRERKLKDRLPSPSRSRRRWCRSAAPRPCWRLNFDFPTPSSCPFFFFFAAAARCRGGRAHPHTLANLSPPPPTNATIFAQRAALLFDASGAPVSTEEAKK